LSFAPGTAEADAGRSQQALGTPNSFDKACWWRQVNRATVTWSGTELPATVADRAAVRTGPYRVACVLDLVRIVNHRNGQRSSATDPVTFK
jgi:hypothetical protein